MFFFFNDTATTEIYTLSLHRRSSDLGRPRLPRGPGAGRAAAGRVGARPRREGGAPDRRPGHLPDDAALRRLPRSEEHTSELQSRQYLVCRLLLEKKKTYFSLTDSLPV